MEGCWVLDVQNSIGFFNPESIIIQVGSNSDSVSFLRVLSPCPIRVHSFCYALPTSHSDNKPRN